jgi:adenosylhomocysteine nucleosidase
VSSTFVVIAALAFEARAVASLGRGMGKEPWGQWMLYRGEMWDLPLAVIRCGPGKVAAAAAAQAAVQYLSPTALISFGTAGSADPTVGVGVLTAAGAVVDVALSELGELPVEIPYRFEPDPNLTRRLLEVPGVKPATLLCWEGQVVSPIRRPPLLRSIDGLVVFDWESAAVAQVAQMWEVPWAAVKAVSDHGEPDRLRYLAAAARRPLQWAAEAVRRACYGFACDRGEVVGPAQPEGEVP